VQAPKPRILREASKKRLNFTGARSVFNDSDSCVSSVADVRFHNADFVKALSYKKLLEEYEIRDQVGEGTYGRVYKALHKPTKLIRALKQIKLPDASLSQAERKRQAKVIEMAENEWDVLKKLDHPSIVRLIDIYRDKQNFYLVTEFCEGCELFDEVCKRDYF
jgi:serine/threonine protein kinase